jgi:hypothetical protein
LPRNDLAHRIAEESERNLMLEACKVQKYPFTKTQDVPEIDWQRFLNETGGQILAEQSPAKLEQVRDRLYEFLSHGNPYGNPHGNPSSAASLNRNLWVSGLSSLTRATDLKAIFSKYGKVVGAKVVTNTKTPGQKCFGYVTMQTSKDATECIKCLNRSELHGRKITVERAKSDLGPSKSKTDIISSSTSEKQKDESGKKTLSSNGSKDGERKRSIDEKSNSSRKKDGSSKPERKRISPPARSKSRSRETSSRSARKEVHPHPPRKNPVIRGKLPLRSPPAPRRDVISLNKLREERERRRLREKELQLREEDRKRMEIRRRQREEEDRLIREREKLAFERRKLEEQKAELLKIERERQKLERERIELERLELKKQQRKYGLIRHDQNFARIFPSFRTKKQFIFLSIKHT